MCDIATFSAMGGKVAAALGEGTTSHSSQLPEVCSVLPRSAADSIYVYAQH